MKQTLASYYFLLFKGMSNILFLEIKSFDGSVSGVRYPTGIGLGPGGAGVKPAKPGTSSAHCDL